MHLAGTWRNPRLCLLPASFLLPCLLLRLRWLQTSQSSAAGEAVQQNAHSMAQNLRSRFEGLRKPSAGLPQHYIEPQRGAADSLNLREAMAQSTSGLTEVRTDKTQAR